MKKWLVSDRNKKVWDRYKNSLIGIDIVDKKTAECFTNNKVFHFARLIFDNSYAMKKFRLLFEENYIYIPDISKKKMRFKTYEANLPPMLRCFHIRQITGCSWVSTEVFKEIKNEEEKKSYCDYEIIVDWRKLNPIEKDFNAPLRIASFDIECYSHDGKFPQARRFKDKIIQIGTTYTYLGESIPPEQHIVCLGETNPVEGAVVEWYYEEKEVIGLEK